MSSPAPGTVTQSLNVVGQGNEAARDRVWALLYDELHKMVHRRLAAESPACKEEATSLSHEAFLCLTGD